MRAITCQSMKLLSITKNASHEAPEDHPKKHQYETDERARTFFNSPKLLLISVWKHSRKQGLVDGNTSLFY